MKLIYLPNFERELLTRTMIIKEKTSWGRSVGPEDIQKMGLSKPRWMKNIYNKKKWRGIGWEAT